MVNDEPNIPILQPYYRRPKGLVGVNTSLILRLLDAVAEPAPGLFVSTDETATGKSFFSFVRRIFGDLVFGKRHKMAESGVWRAISQAVNKLDDSERR